MTIFCVLFEYIIGMGSSSMCIHGAEQNVLQTLTEKSVSLPEINTLERHKKLLICVQSIRRGNWEVRQGRFCGLYYLLPLYFFFPNNPPRSPASFWENCWASSREYIHPNPCELFNSFRGCSEECYFGLTLIEKGTFFWFYSWFLWLSFHTLPAWWAQCKL